MPALCGQMEEFELKLTGFCVKESGFIADFGPLNSISFRLAILDSKYVVFSIVQLRIVEVRHCWTEIFELLVSSG